MNDEKIKHNSPVWSGQVIKNKNKKKERDNETNQKDLIKRNKKTGKIWKKKWNKNETKNGSS